MALTARTLALAVALVLFVAAALGFGSGRFSFVAAGLAFLTVALWTS